VAEFAYHWGRKREQWAHLLPALEKYHKETLGCVGMTIHAPPYWRRALEDCGYKPTHTIMEKEF
jgi:hypothetical protein